MVKNNILSILLTKNTIFGFIFGVFAFIILYVYNKVDFHVYGYNNLLTKEFLATGFPFLGYIIGGMFPVLVPKPHNHKVKIFQQLYIFTAIAILFGSWAYYHQINEWDSLKNEVEKFGTNINYSRNSTEFTDVSAKMIVCFNIKPGLNESATADQINSYLVSSNKSGYYDDEKHCIIYLERGRSPTEVN